MRLRKWAKAEPCKGTEMELHTEDRGPANKVEKRSLACGSIATQLILLPDKY